MATFTGTAAADTITGTIDADVINGGAGKDIIRSGSGIDLVHGDDGNDNINGEAGDDILYGDLGDDTLAGDAGNDKLYGGDGIDGMFGGGNNDQLYGGNGNDTMFGDGGDDLLDGGMGADKLTGGIGNDTFIVTAGEGGDIITGGAGIDTLELRFTASDVTPALRADFAAYQNYMDQQLAAAGGLTALSTQTAGTPFTFASLGMTISGTEAIVLKLDGNTVALQTFLNAAPVALNDVVTVLEDTPVSGNVLGNDSDFDGNALSVTGYTVAGQQGAMAAGTSTVIDGVGTLLINSNGAYSFTPVANYNGAVPAVTYTVTDGNGGTASASLMLGSVIAVNDAPVTAASASISTLEDTPVSGQVIASDVDGDALSYSTAQGPAHGTVTLDNNTGAYVYQAAADYNGADTFSVTVEDGSGASAVQQIAVTVGAVNDAPVTAANASLSTLEDTPVSGQVVASDVDGDTLGFTVGQGPAHGTLVVNQSTGDYVYRSAANYSGADGFTVMVKDASGASVSQRVEISVAPVVDAPSLTIANVAANAGHTIIGTSGNDVLTGGAGADVINGGAGNDTIYGDGAGTVTVALGIQALLQDKDGSETLSLTVQGVPSGAMLSAGLNNGNGSWTLTAQDLGGLTITASDASDFTLNVTATASESDGSTSAQSAAMTVAFERGGGNDRLSDGDGNDTVYGGLGNDQLIVGKGNDIYDGGDGFDTLDMSAATSGVNVDLSRSTATGLGTDKVLNVEGVIGSAFDDTLTGGKTDSLLWGGAGNDKMMGGAGNDYLDGGNGNDNLDGGSGDDILSDGNGNDVVNGGAGDDRFIAGDGDDRYTGGSGFDTLDYSAATRAINVDASKKTITGFSDDRVDGIEKFIGTSFDDVFNGSKTANFFDGGAGNDSFRGMGGADVYTGGSGDDKFVWFVKDVLSGVNSLGADVITDFGNGNDTLNLHEFTKAYPTLGINSVVHINDTAAGSMLSVKTAHGFIDLVMLQDVHNVTVDNLLDSGMILT